MPTLVPIRHNYAALNRLPEFGVLLLPLIVFLVIGRTVEVVKIIPALPEPDAPTEDAGSVTRALLSERDEPIASQMRAGTALSEFPNSSSGAPVLICRRASAPTPTVHASSTHLANPNINRARVKSTIPIRRPRSRCRHPGARSAIRSRAILPALGYPLSRTTVRHASSRCLRSTRSRVRLDGWLGQFRQGGNGHSTASERLNVDNSRARNLSQSIGS